MSRVLAAGLFALTRNGQVGAMRVVIVGATGNVGTSLVQALAAEDRVTSVLGLARRLPAWRPDKTKWDAVDIATDELAPHLRGADAVVHLAWLFQPTHDPVQTWRTNVLGSMRVFEATAAAQVPALIYASSVGAYSPGPAEQGLPDRPVDESWPTHGWPIAPYCMEKAYLERVLDGFERDHPELRVVRMRPAFIFKRQAAMEQRRLFAGPLLPHPLIRPRLLPVLPGPAGLRFQAVHSADAAEAYRLAIGKDVSGAFNIAADPVVDTAVIAGLLEARSLRTPVRPLRALLAAAWRLHLVPASPQLFDAVLRLPIMDTARARGELGWTPRYSALEAIREFLDGLRAGAGMDTPPLAEDAGGPGRIREFATGVGARANSDRT
jgi:UDP-glucose 4-epimerase